jgi:hypothetical protein
MGAEKGTECNVDEKGGVFYIRSLLSICHHDEKGAKLQMTTHGLIWLSEQ